MATLALDLRHPASAFLYNATTPKVSIDGVEVPGANWGQFFVPVPAGPHRVEIYIPYALPRRAGRAVLDLTVPEPGVSLEYMAPTITFAKGSLGVPGEQKSAGLRAVHTLNIVVIAAVVIGVLVARFL
jgi:hypothetical protein